MRFAALAVCAALAACGGGAGTSDDDATTPDAGDDTACAAADAPDLSARYYPWKVGTVWTNLLTNPLTGDTEVNDTTVDAYEAIGHGHPGQCGFRVSGEKLFGNTISWNGYEGDIGVRYAQEDFDISGAQTSEQDNAPYRLKMDETPAHMTAYATYTESFDETTIDASGTVTRAKSENWTVISTSESVTVPAGTYDALHLRRVNPDGNKTKDFWFVAGVGKVKEVGGEQNQELMSYTP
jgi:hypothetical protein